MAGQTGMKDLHLFVVDDSPAELQLVAEAVLEFAPDVILTTATTRAGLFAALATAVKPDLILLDLHMGTDHGSDIAREVQRQMEGTIPLVILTTVEDAVEQARCLAAGAIDFWVKPFRFDDYEALFVRIRELLAQRGELFAEKG